MLKAVTELRSGDHIRFGAQIKEINIVSPRVTTTKVQITFTDGTSMFVNERDVFDTTRPNVQMELTSEELDYIAGFSFQRKAVSAHANSIYNKAMELDARMPRMHG